MLKHDPEKWAPVFPRDRTRSVCRGRSCSISRRPHADTSLAEARAIPSGPRASKLRAEALSSRRSPARLIDAALQLAEKASPNRSRSARRPAGRRLGRRPFRHRNPRRADDGGGEEAQRRFRDEIRAGAREAPAGDPLSCAFARLDWLILRWRAQSGVFRDHFERPLLRPWTCGRAVPGQCRADRDERTPCSPRPSRKAAPRTDLRTVQIAGARWSMALRG